MLPIGVGLAGLGRMGAMLVPHLIQGCSSVNVWNRSGGKCEEAALAGAHISATPRELTQNADVVLSILHDDEAVEAVYLGPDGLLAGGCSGRVFEIGRAHV